ncbi:MAG: tyrosine-type recombinase/integrase [Aliivibrio sp.]|uniref:tyrosine-type recombinase/integrase n=1 Tax=Aliivibrio sp. TaxID=1872443 RepID=UPI001A4E58F0|nr:tyrosine-type recombinase/integrase [Aliivibrio sp.]
MVTITKRELASGPCYYARIKLLRPELANGKPYINRTLNTSDKTVAIRLANDIYTDLYHKQQEGRTLVDLTVSQAIDQYMTWYREGYDAEVSGFSKPMLKNFEKSIEKYWKEYIGNKPLNHITHQHITDYEIWRKGWAKNPTFKNIKNKSRHGNHKRTIANRTLVWELNAFKQCLRWCSERHLYKGHAYLWKAGKRLLERERRAALSRGQWETLWRYMRKPEFRNKGKHKNDKKLLRHRNLLRAYILFMGNTGMRVGEARNLKWGDIEPRRNKRMDEVPIITIQKEFSKVRKKRRVIGRRTALEAIERWKKFLVDTGEGWAGDTFIFCNPVGETINHFRESFKAVIEEAGLDIDSSGRPTNFTPYSLRHTYITLRIQKAEDMTIYNLAKNCGTSVQMIQQFYDDSDTTDFIDEMTL